MRRRCSTRPGSTGSRSGAAYPTVNVYGVDFDTLMAKVQQDLSVVGIELELEPLDFNTFIEQLLGDGTALAALYFAPDHVDPSQYVQYFGMIEDGGGWMGYSHWQPNADEGALFVEALASAGDARVDAYNRLGQMMIDDLIIFPLVNPDLVLAYASDLTGVRYSACCNLELGGVGVA